jgi:hydroxymethylglutaryl-CoA synthase
MSTSPNGHGILATTRYLPRLRLERSDVYTQHRWMAPSLKSLAKGRRAMASWDEDSITMAVEAARALLATRAGEPTDADLCELTLASTTLPFAERLNAAVVAAALGLPSSIAARDVTSSARAASTELADALSRPAAGTRILLAAERRVARPASAQEMIGGDGAAGALIGPGPAIATPVATASVLADFVDHFRAAGEDYDYGWEERWVREAGYMTLAVDAIAQVLAKASVGADEVAHFAMPAPIPRINEMIARRAGIRPEAVVGTDFDVAGDLGCAQPLAMLDAALRGAAEGSLVLVVALGSGCDALLLRRTGVRCLGPVPGDGRSESSYLKYLSFTGQVALEWGMRAEMDNKTALTAAWREGAMIAHFEAGRCSRCGTVQFPRSKLCVNPQCRAAGTQEPKSLAEIPARILSHTSDWLAYSPSPPLKFGHIDFEGGGRVLMEIVDAEPDELEVGKRVRMVYRIKDFDHRRGFRRYFWKATPLRESHVEN